MNSVRTLERPHRQKNINRRSCDSTRPFLWSCDSAQFLCSLHGRSRTSLVGPNRKIKNANHLNLDSHMKPKKSGDGSGPMCLAITSLAAVIDTGSSIPCIQRLAPRNSVSVQRAILIPMGNAGRGQKRSLLPLREGTVPVGRTLCRRQHKPDHIPASQRRWCCRL